MYIYTCMYIYVCNKNRNILCFRIFQLFQDDNNRIIIDIGNVTKFNA